MVLQSDNLRLHMTVLENVAADRAGALRARIGLPEKRHAYPSGLSANQQHRAAIVRALATKARLMHFDEVTAALAVLARHINDLRLKTHMFNMDRVREPFEEGHRGQLAIIDALRRGDRDKARAFQSQPENVKLSIIEQLRSM
jgi:DNA-binding GntR family transcriptional regulator